MSNIFSSKKLVDRKNETEYIINDINNFDKTKNKMLFIWSDSGIGKSSIVHKVNKSNEIHIPIVSIETPPINNSELIGNGDFISSIAEGISDYFNGEGYSLKNFLSFGLSDRLQKSETSKMLANITNLPSAVFSTLCERILSLNDADAEKIIHGFDLDSILINLEYIKSMLSNFCFVLNVSNIQNADPMSLLQLQKMLANLNGQYLIFEYTTKDRKTDNLWQIAKIFENVADIDIYEINELPIEYALTILEQTNLSGIEELEKFYKTIAKGNLYKLYRINDEVNGKSSLNQFKDPIKVCIEKLNYQQKMILAIICLHDGEILKNEFNDIIDFISDQFYISSNEVKYLSNFIGEKNGKYILHHASIIDSFDMSSDNFAALAAYRLLEGYFSFKITQSHFSDAQRHMYIFQKIKLYSLFDPSKILENLEEFKELVISTLSEAQGAKLLNNIFSSLQVEDEHIKIHIVKIGYEVGFYISAFKLLSQLHYNSDDKSMLECMLLNRIDKHNETISKCTIFLNENNHSDRFILIINMIKMLSERSLNNKKKYVETFRAIFNNKKYMHFYEYGFLLRNSQIVFSFQESLEYIKQSINFFTLRNSFKDAARSELTYAVQLARLGFVSDAIEHFEKIKLILLNSTFEKHIVYLNQSSFSMLNGTSDENTLLLLEKSMLSATTNFDKVVILNNKLCWYIVHQIDEQLFLNLKQQLDYYLRTEPDLRLHRRTYINYSKYYLNVQNEVKISEKWMNKARAILAIGDELGDCYIYGKCDNEELEYLSKKPFYISFITYWNFDLPIN